MSIPVVKRKKKKKGKADHPDLSHKLILEAESVATSFQPYGLEGRDSKGESKVLAEEKRKIGQNENRKWQKYISVDEQSQHLP